MKNADSIETELTLVIAAGHPGAVAKRITEMATVGNFRLVARPRVTLEDTYFDSQDDGLTRREWGLRTRSASGAVKVALKGPATRLESGAVRRIEFEKPWSESSLREVLRRMEDLGIGLSAGVSEGAPLDHISYFVSAGMKILQARETRREIRDVFAFDSESATPVAEFDIDLVSYCFEGRIVRHWELELEALGSLSEDVFRSFTRSLKSFCGDHLRPWSHNKLATGIAIERLLERGYGNDLLDGENLRASSYELIHDYLSK